MYELIGQLRALTRGIWKHRWLGLLVAWIAAGIGVAVVTRIPNKYEASARVFVDTESILKPLMSGLTVQPDVTQQVVMLSRTLISRPNVEKLIRMADLDLNSESQAEREATIARVTRTLRIASAGRDNLYTIAYSDPSPERAKRAVQSLVSIFVESSLGASRKDADAAKLFLDEQIKSYRTKLEEAEARLKEFRLRNIDLRYGDGKDAGARLAELSEQLDRAKIELREAENARDAAKAALAAERQTRSGALTQGLLQESALAVSTPEIDARVDAQRRHLDALLQRFTDQHPEVSSARRMLRDLEEEKRKQMQERRKAALDSAPSGAIAGGVGSLVAQELGRVSAASEIQVASLRARVSEYSARYEQARAKLKVAPQLEAEASQLNRDYTIHKKNYEDLVARRESATISGELDGSSGMAEFRLIDPPMASPTPVSPKRPLLLWLVLIVSLGAGAAAAFVASQLRPTFHTTADLKSALHVPVLGAVSFVMSAVDKRRERNDFVRFCVAFGLLPCAFAAGLATMSLWGGR